MARNSYVVTKHGQIVIMQNYKPLKIMSAYDAILHLDKLADETEYKNLEFALKKVDIMEPCSD